MKLYVALLHLFSILAFAGCALGDGATDGDCPFVQGTTLLDMAAEIVGKCFIKVGEIDLEELKEIGSQYIAQPEFERYCGRHDLIKSCISTTISAKSSACHEETHREALVILEDVLKIGQDYSCFDGGASLASTMFGVFNMESSTPGRNVVTDCFDVAKATGVESDAAVTRVLGFYREIKVFRKCLMEGILGHNAAIFRAELMLNGMLRAMKCPHHEDGTTVLCETLDASSSTGEDHACILEGKVLHARPRFIDLADYVTLCSMVNVNHITFDHLDDFTTIDEYKTFLSTFCENRPRIRDCFGDVLSHSKVCQNQTDHSSLKMIVDFMEFTLETGCNLDGTTSATILNGIFNHAAGVISEAKIRECTTAAQTSSKSLMPGTTSTPAKVLVAYRHLDSLAKCFLDGASEDGSFKTDFATFTNEVLGSAKCVNPEDETVVSCKTLVDDDN